MSIIKKILFVFVTGVVTMVFAQKVDSNAKNILDVVSAHYKSKNAIYFKFIYATADKNEMGEFYTYKDKYRLKIMGSEQIFDGNKIYSINEEEQEVTVSKTNNGENILSPMSYLEAYKKNYNIIKLTPIKNNKIKQVLLYINFAKKQIEKVEQYTANNAKTSIIISQYKENIAVSSSVFSFNKNQYKNYLITEL